jgi:8-oxo-dGTP pyrophosphatase MutT (NUDIX family)
MPFLKKQPFARLTHAGGVVYRTKYGAAHYLLVSPKLRADEWILPKGHIEKHEQPEQAAAREVLEETGIITRIICPLTSTQFKVQGKDVCVQFFLMEQIGNGTANEERAIGWFPFEEARRKLTHAESKEVLDLAERQRMSSHQTGPAIPS